MIRDNERERIKVEIMTALMQLSEKSPLTAISLRDIASHCGMSHTKILRFFNTKNELLTSCIAYACSFMLDEIEKWFDNTHAADFPSKKAYLDAFFEYFQHDTQDVLKPSDVVMSCALGAYSKEIKDAVQEEFRLMRKLVDSKLRLEFGRNISQDEVTAVCAMFFGIYFMQFNDAIPGDVLCRPVSTIEGLTVP